MKKSKIAFAAVLMAITGFLLLMNACQKEDMTNSIEDDEVVVSDFLKMSTSADNTVTCSRGDSLPDSLGRHRRHHIDITEIDVATLPAAVNSYVAANYAGATINKAGTDSLGYFYVKVLKADGSYVGLLFDASGTFIKLIHRGHDGKKGTVVSSSALPAAITTYIAANYATATFKKAELEDDNTYKVILVQADGSFIGLAFDANGNFVSTISVKDKHGKKKRKH